MGGLIPFEDSVLYSLFKLRATRKKYKVRQVVMNILNLMPFTMLHVNIASSTGSPSVRVPVCVHLVTRLLLKQFPYLLTEINVTARLFQQVFQFRILRKNIKLHECLCDPFSKISSAH